MVPSNPTGGAKVLRRKRAKSHETVADCWSLDIASLVPLLADSGQSTWIGLRRGELRSSIRVETIDPEHIELHFRFIRWGAGSDEAPWEEELNQPLTFARVARRRGERTFFVCPECRRHRSVLYALPHFLCRVCHRLAYPSQRRSSIGRLAKALQRRVELGGRSCPWDAFPHRPIGMSRKRYERLKKADLELIKPYLREQILNAAFLTQWFSVFPKNSSKSLKSP